MHILVSGLVNTETTTAVRGFPIQYYPIDYAFFGVNTSVSGVAFNIAKALTKLSDEVQLTSMTGNDFSAAYILNFSYIVITFTESGVGRVNCFAHYGKNIIARFFHSFTNIRHFSHCAKRAGKCKS